MELSQSSEEEIRELLLWKSVSKVNDETLVLSDGTILEIVPNDGCGGCTSGYYHIDELNEFENAITNVEFETIEEDDDYDGETTYRIFVLAKDTRFKLLEVSGTDGNGWYGSGYRINVKLPT